MSAGVPFEADLPAPGAGGAAARAEHAMVERGLDRPLHELAQRHPVSCPPQTPLRAALQMMTRERVGSIVVVDPDGRPLGVLTLGDVLTRVTLPQASLDVPIEQVMTRRVFTLSMQAPAFEAALLMARENIRHVPLLDGERLAGVVSESRLFALWRRSIGAVRAAIAAAGDIDSVVRAAAGLRALPARLLYEGLAADSITSLVSSLNDLIVERLVECTGMAAALKQAGGCWIALGSQGRGEQTLATDQDNAIVFSDGADPQSGRQALLPLALELNQALDRCGFALCRGEIMASNPQWCLSLAEWQARFSSWIDRPEPQALLNAAIFFDFRPVSGDPTPALRLRDWLTAHARESDRFLLLMVFNALRNAPPLGLLRDFVLERGGEHPHTLDLKVSGVQAFVEVARILALRCAVPATHTIERLAGAGQALQIPVQEVDAWRDAFNTLQRLRLRLNAHQQADGVAVHNHLDPSTLNDLDRNVLKEALRQARGLQGRLASVFSLSGTTLRA
jgi:CBS domain-containing protein